MAAYRIVIHAGYPKAASTALQDALVNSRTLLRHRGILYPEALMTQGLSKHEELFRLLRLNKPDQAIKQLQAELNRIKDIHTVVLSTESIVNQLDNIDETRWAALFEKLKRIGTIETLVIRRAADGFLKSYYKQAVVNQPSPLMRFYGTGLCLEEFSKLPEIQSLLDVNGRLEKLKRISGGGGLVKVFDYGPEIVNDVFSWLTGGARLELSTQVNVSLSPETVEFIRQLNITTPGPGVRNAWLRVLRRVANFSDLDSRTASTLADRAGDSDILSLDPLWPLSVQTGKNPDIGVDDGKLSALTHSVYEFLHRYRQEKAFCHKTGGQNA